MLMDLQRNVPTTATTDASRVTRIRRVLWGTLALNLFVCALKAVLGGLTGSVALLADSVHSLFDSVSNIVGLTATSIASRPADADHPYGHQKVEVVAALIIGLLIILGMVELGRHAVAGWMEGRVPEIEPWMLATVVLGMVINIGVSTWERRVGKQLDSEILTADAAHTASDAFATLAVLVGLILTMLGVPAADLLAAAVVVAMVGFAGFKIIRRALLVLVDTSCIEPEAVIKLTRDIAGLRSCHNVRSRGMDGHVHLDLHVTFEPSMSLHDAGEGMLKLKRRIREAFPNVRDIVIQLEPHLPAFLDD